MMKVVSMQTLAVSLVLASALAASAATTLSSPFVAASVDGACLVTNVSRKPIAVTGRLLDQSGGAHALAVDTCSPAPIEPGATCVVGALTSSPPTGEAIYRGFSCSIVASSNKVRAIAYGSSGPGTALAIVPATVK